ncbi:hypothetical protein D3C81_2032480 [compost metagenome]
MTGIWRSPDQALSCRLDVQFTKLCHNYVVVIDNRFRNVVNHRDFEILGPCGWLATIDTDQAVAWRQVDASLTVDLSNLRPIGELLVQHLV